MRSFCLWLLVGAFIAVWGADIENARAIITGGANGIGYACAYDLLRNGAQAVAILDYDVENGTVATERLINAFGTGRALFFPTDVSDPFQFETDFMMAVKLLGGLDIMINNAGLSNDAIWRKEIDTNIKGEVQGTLMSFDVMGKHKGGKGGTVINIGSIASVVPNQYLPIYIATKFAILGFSRSIALSYDITGVAVKTMCPGPTDTYLQTNEAHRFLEFLDYDEAVKVVESFPMLLPVNVSKDVMRLIEEAPNGAIWLDKKDQPTIALDIPYYREWGRPV